MFQCLVLWLFLVHMLSYLLVCYISHLSLYLLEVDRGTGYSFVQWGPWQAVASASHGYQLGVSICQSVCLLSLSLTISLYAFCLVWRSLFFSSIGHQYKMPKEILILFQPIFTGHCRTGWNRKWQPTLVSCLENSMDRGAWQATVHGIAKSQTPLSMHVLEQICQAFCLFWLCCPKHFSKY